MLAFKIIPAARQAGGIIRLASERVKEEGWVYSPKRMFTPRQNRTDVLYYLHTNYLMEAKMTKHSIVHVEIPAESPAEAAQFYKEAFAWETQDFPEMNYITFDVGDGPGGGFPKTDENIKPGDVIVYINTDDIEGSLAKIEELGGNTVLPKTEIPQTGWFAMFLDPFGNTLALYTPMPQK